MTLSPQDKAAVEAQWAAHRALASTGTREERQALLTADALASLLSSRAPGVGLKRYNASAVTIDAEHFIPGPVPVYLASEVDASHPREWTAENIGEAPDEGVYFLKSRTHWNKHWYSKAEAVAWLGDGHNKMRRAHGPHHPPRS